ncbi:MAG: precorrin-8X methylmutase [Alphaproteobacteria bacterium]|nr:precorrin-8X methylmutase [Alphaproteobacteria bacterium]
MVPYLKDPAAIYRKSFATVRAETSLDGMPPEVADTALRMVHACGMPDIVDDLRYSVDVVAAARTAFDASAPILADCTMVVAGILKAHLADGVGVHCYIDDPAAKCLAADLATTRSAAAVELWRPVLDGAVVVIGNAPTALFRLLEVLDEGGPRPAAIVACPVGFVGAAESKQALADNPRGVPYLTLLGRRGGSAIAAAAINAVLVGAAT